MKGWENFPRIQTRTSDPIMEVQRADRCSKPNWRFLNALPSKKLKLLKLILQMIAWSQKFFLVFFLILVLNVTNR